MPVSWIFSSLLTDEVHSFPVFGLKGTISAPFFNPQDSPPMPASCVFVPACAAHNCRPPGYCLSPHGQAVSRPRPGASPAPSKGACHPPSMVESPEGFQGPVRKEARYVSPSRLATGTINCRTPRTQSVAFLDFIRKKIIFLEIFGTISCRCVFYLNHKASPIQKKEFSSPSHNRITEFIDPISFMGCSSGSFITESIIWKGARG